MFYVYIHGDTLHISMLHYYEIFIITIAMQLSGYTNLTPVNFYVHSFTVHVCHDAL